MEDADDSAPVAMAPFTIGWLSESGAEGAQQSVAACANVARPSFVELVQPRPEAAQRQFQILLQ